MQTKLQEIIEDDNAKAGTRRSQSSPEPFNSLSDQNGHARPLSVPRVSEIQSNSSNRPLSQPVGRPYSTRSEHGYGQDTVKANGSKSGDDPLVVRFSQLRTSATPAARLPYPTGSNSLDFPTAKSGINEHYDNLQLSHVTSAPDPRETRPSGPRQMPGSNKGPPPPPPKKPFKPTITTSLPRAPSPVYSPARNIAAPASIEPPRSSARSSGPLPSRNIQPSTNGYQLPPQNYTSRDAASVPTSRDFAQRPPLPEKTMFSAHDVWTKYYKKGYRVLFIDTRSRRDFDEGHMALEGSLANVICLESHDVGSGKSFREMYDDLTLAPDDEKKCLNNIGRYGLVILYDENTESDSFLRGHESKSTAPALRNLYDTLTSYNYEPADKCDPKVLLGGIAGWAADFGPQSLVGSRKSMIRSPRRNTDDEFSQSSKRLRRGTAQLTADEAERYREKAQREQVPPVKIDPEQEGGVQYAHSYDDFFDFFKRFPPVEQESMIMPKPGPAPSETIRKPVPSPRPPVISQPAAGAPARPPPHTITPIPSVPSRPAPAVSRPSYGGVSDRQPSQPSAGRVVSTQAQPYVTRFVAQSLKLHRTGLFNFGSTCYMNASLQCLLGTLPLTRFFLDDTWRSYVQIQPSPDGSSGIMPEVYATLVRTLWKDDKKMIRPANFRHFFVTVRTAFRDDHTQQDAQEFMSALLDCLHADLNTRARQGVLRNLTTEQLANRDRIPVAKASRIEWDRFQHNNYSFLDTLFRSQVVKHTACHNCRHTVVNYEPYLVYSLTIPSKTPCNLNDCLEHWGNEVLDDYTCDRCKSKGSHQTTRISRMPQILIFQFVRTIYQGKNSKQIDFPLHGLDMAPYMANTYQPHRDGEDVDHATAPPFMFECYAVLRHHGDTINSGHYTAAVRDTARGGVWRYFDDTNSEDFDPRSRRQWLQDKDAYLVFYERSRGR